MVALLPSFSIASSEKNLNPVNAAVPSSRRVAGNFFWLASDQVVRFAINFGVSVALVRYLGPDANGLLASCLSLFAFGAAISEMGLETILRRDLVRTPSLGGRLLATAAGVRFFMALPVYGVAVFLALRLPGMSDYSPLLVWTLGAAVFQPVAFVFDSWFHAQTKAKYGVWSQTSGMVVSAVVRIVLMAGGATLAAFGWPLFIEVVVSSIGLGLFFRRQGCSLRGAGIDLGLMRQLWLGAWPILLTNVAILACTRVDVLILMWLGGSEVAGHYAAAVRLSDLAVVVPMLLITATTPGITALQQGEPREYLARLQQLITTVTVLAGVTALGLTVLAGPIVELLYGDAYAAAAWVLALHSWGAVFAVQGAARSIWLLLADQQRYGLLFLLIGLAVSLTLNLYLIPRWGAAGAAVAAVAAKIAIAWIAPVLFAPTRPSLHLLARALLLKRDAPARML